MQTFYYGLCLSEANGWKIHSVGWKGTHGPTVLVMLLIFLYISKNMNCCFLGCNACIVGWMFPSILKEGIVFILMGPVHQEDDAASCPTRPQFSETLLWKPQTLNIITVVHHSFWNTCWGLKDCQRFTFDWIVHFWGVILHTVTLMKV
jgi:hypothetical protein